MSRFRSFDRSGLLELQQAIRVVEIDPAVAASKRLSSGSDIFRERRPGLHGALTEPLEEA